MEEQEIKEAYEKLPELIKNIILDSNWKQNVGRLGPNFNLRIDQLAEIEIDVEMIMLGLLSVSDFVDILKNDLEIKDNQKIDSIVQDLEKNIFQKIRNSLVEKSESFENSVKQTQYEAPIITPHSKDDILKEIELEDEKASAPETIPTNPLAQKLNTGTTNQTEEINLTNKADQKPTTPQNYQSADPYREPIH